MTYDMKQAGREMAARGRYGDTQLVHLNDVEVAGLASLSPTGRLTTNPDTGLPEAFLPFLAPILGSVAGGFLGPALGISTALGAGLGSGLASWATTGDLGQGIMSGLLSYGMGTGLNSLAGIGAGAAGANPATAASGLASGASGGINPAAMVPGMGALPNAPVPVNAPNIAGLGAPMATGAPLGTPGATDVFTGAAAQGLGGMPGGGSVLPPGGVDALPFGDKLGYAWDAISGPGGMGHLGDALLDNALPIGLGLGSLAPPSRGLKPRNGRGLGGSGEKITDSFFPRSLRFPGPDYRPGTDPEFRYFAEGGEVNPLLEMLGPKPEAPNEKQIIQEAVLAIKRQHPQPKVAIQRFIEVFGPDRFEALVAQVMQGEDTGRDGNQIVGPGGGMDDMVPAQINAPGQLGTQDALLSDGEYVVPSDAVSALGDGSTDEGVRRLEDMINRIRMSKTGSNEQPGPISAGVMPA